MVVTIFEYLLRWAWDIIFLIRLNILLKKVPYLRKLACKQELIRGGVEFDATSFVACASSGRLPEVVLFTCAGILVNMPASDGNTALIMAARQGHKDVVCHLLGLSEMDPGTRNDAGDTALLLAAREGHRSIVTKLLEQPGIDVNTQNKAGESALLEAARRGYDDIVQQLQSKGAEEPELEKKVVRWQLEQEGIFSYSEYLRNVQKGDVGLVEKFLIAGMDPNTSDDSKNTALIIAAREDNVEIVGHLLVQDDILVNHSNKAGDTALLVAAREGHRSIVTKLLEQSGIDVNTRNKAGESALLEAARRGYDDIVQQLQSKGAEEPELEKKVARWQLEQNGIFTEKHFVRFVAGGNVELVRKYLRAGINVNSQDDRQNTALIVAVCQNQLEMVKILLAQPEINVHLRNYEGFSAAEIANGRNYPVLTELLQEAGADLDLERVSLYRLEKKGLQFRPDVFVSQAARGQKELVALFIDAGMHPNAENDRGDTGLIEATRNGQKPVVELLLSRGVDVNLRNCFGYSALEVAERSGDMEIANLLRRSGAKAADPSKETMLDAIEKGDIKGVEAALEQGISPKAYTEEGEPVLIAAVRQGHQEIVNILLKRGALVDARDREHKTALMRAAELGLTGMIRSLMNADANLEEIDSDGSTPLMLAIWHGRVKAVQILIEAGANIYARDNSGRTVQMIANLKRHPEIIRLFTRTGLEEESLEANLLAAAARGDDAEVKMLLEAGAKPELPDQMGNTPLALAASRGWIKVIKALEPVGGLIEKANVDGDTPLMQAARGGHLSTVKFLLEQEIKIDALNKRGETALLQAARAGRGTVVIELAEKGANPNLAASETTPLMEACYHDQLEAVKALLEKDADIEQKLDYGFSPLMTTILAGHEDIEEELRNKGAKLGDLEGRVFLNTMDGNDEGLLAVNLEDIDLNARDCDGWTALMVASREGFVGIAKLLLDAGALTDIRSRDGKTTALLEAASNGHTGILKLLIPTTKSDATSALIEAASHGHAEAVRLLAQEAGARINGRDKGRVPLIEAAMRGHLQVVQVLLELGADKEKKSRDGLTAIMAAQLHKHDKVVELLIESGFEEGLKEASLLLAASEGKDDEVDRLLSHPIPPKIDARDEEGRTALMRACERNHLAVVYVLFRHMDEESKQAAASDKDYQGRTPLMLAAQGGSIQIVQRLLALKVDIHAESSDGRTALMEACRQGRFEIVKMLLNPLDNDSRRVAVNHQDGNGNTPLSEALMQEYPWRQGDYEGIVRLLEGYGAELGREAAKSAEFLHAVRENDLDKVNELIDQVDFKKLRFHGKTPLMLCAEAGCFDVAKILIGKGIDLNDTTDQYGTTALMMAVTEKHQDILQLLLKSGADCNRLDSKESNALIKAVQLEAEDIVSDLISAGANVNHRDSSGNTALIVAVLKDNPRLVQLLLDGMRKLNLDRPDRNRRTALTLAHLRGKRSQKSEKDLPPRGEPIQEDILKDLTQIERLLMEAGARNGWNEAEFIHTARNGDSKHMQNLIEDGVDVNIRDIDGSTALLIACQMGDPEIAQILISKGASVEVRNHNDRTPLMEAAKQKSLKLVEQLFQAYKNLDPNAQDKEGETALLEATRAGKPDIVQFLVDKGSNVNTANRRGETPIIKMAGHPHLEPIQTLLKHGANACARDTNHRTAIIEAAEQGHLSILEILLNHLDDRLRSSKRMIVINAVDHKSRTAVDWAEIGGFHDCVKLLRQYGGKSVRETEYVVYTTPTGDCYHHFNCRTIQISRYRGSLKERLLRDAVRYHYKFCDVCKPSLKKIDWTC